MKNPDGGNIVYLIYTILKNNKAHRLKLYLLLSSAFISLVFGATKNNSNFPRLVH